MKLLSREEVSHLDRMTIGPQLTEKQLIQEVGQELARWLTAHLTPRSQVLILQGPGNNGQDGLALRGQLKSQNISVDLVNWQDSNVLSSVNFENYDLVVDSLFGTGLDRPLPEELQHNLLRCNAAMTRRIAIDIPSGLDANTGEVYGTCFQAHHTLTIAAPKRGLYLLPARKYCGEIHTIEVKPLKDNLPLIESQYLALPNMDFRSLAPPLDTHKYKRGVVAVALNEDFPGAALLAAYGAQKSGCGYVKVLCPQDQLATCQITHPSLVFISYSSKQELWELIESEKFDTLLIGAGWKAAKGADCFPLNDDKFYVFDGGFLTPKTLHSIADSNNCILTPHSGELARMLETSAKTKSEQVHEITHQIQGLVVAKGYDTLIAQQGKKSYLTTWNSPSLSVAGSGDILAGMIASMVAQLKTPHKACLMAVDAHRRSALDSPIAFTPMKLLENIGPLLNSVPK